MENPFLRGSISGLIACTIVQPFDVIKTSIITYNRDFTISDSMRFVKEKYGFKGFWRGIRPASYKAVLGSGMSFYYLETLKLMISHERTGFISNTLIGMISRLFTIVSLSPLSVVKVRMEAPQTIGYNSVTEGIFKIYREEGAKGYYKGLGSCLMRDLPFSGLSYGFYQFFSKKIANFSGVDTPALLHKAAAGILAGFTATLLTQPFDIIKTRQQFSHISKIQNHEYKNVLCAIRKIYQTEGIKGFTLGLKIRLIERSSGFATVWFIYERLKLVSA